MGESRSVAAPRLLLVLLVVLSPLIIAWLVVMLVFRTAAWIVLHVAVWCWWLPRGRDILIVYSESPMWQHHMEHEVLPALATRAVVLNWSQRRRWKVGLAVAVFHHFGGRTEFNPLAVVFRPLRPARVFRFWQPFRDWKHGRPQRLELLEQELFACVGVKKEIQNDPRPVAPETATKPRDH